jgi:prepilin signal peptidase PulO-like enzyme (type II secretory pathway)
MKGYLKYVSFNATEFTFGLAFRFQNVNKFGNYQLNCEQLEEVKGDIRIADAIASSSCFPGGFDPMIFPNDYIEDHKSQSYLNLIGVENFKNGVGIMDGGIVDNQGIGSMVNFDKSLQEGFPLDLLIVNDVDGYKMPPWEKYKPSNVSSEKESVTSLVNRYLGYLQMKPIYWLGLIVGILGLFGFYKLAWLNASIILAVLVGVFSLLTVFGFFGNSLVKTLKQKVNDKFVENMPHALIDDVEKFTKLDISQFRKMIENRFTSAVSMINYVFLRQIRRMNFDLFYSSPRFVNRRITSMVYQLNGQQNTVSNEDQKRKVPEINVSAKIQESALIASKMPTTLWWDEQDLKENRQDNLIACGQFTTCYNLIKYIQDLPHEYHTDQAKDLERALLYDWAKFEENPLVFVVKG